MSLIEEINKLLFPKWRKEYERVLITSISYNGTKYKLRTYFKIFYSQIRDEFKLVVDGHNPSSYLIVEKEMYVIINEMRASKNGENLDNLIEKY